MNRARLWSLALLSAGVLGVAVDPLPAGAAGPSAVHTAGGVLNVRSGPSTSDAVVASLPNGTAVTVVCAVMGQTLSGVVRTTSAWDRLSAGQYVSDAYIDWAATAPVPCGSTGSADVLGLLNLRSNASTLLAPVGIVGAGQALTVTCQLGGESIAGRSRTTAMWDRLPAGALVSDAYVGEPGGRPGLPWCVLSTGEAPGDHPGFIRWAATIGQQLRPTYRVPVSVTVAQAILESGWGGSSLTADGNSFFGMKCFGSPGTIATGCRPYSTHECDSSCYPTTASFRVYATATASFVDHANQLGTLPRYRPAFAFVNDPDRFAVEIYRAGYATSPTYAQDLIALMHQFDLYQYDTLL